MYGTVPPENSVEAMVEVIPQNNPQRSSGLRALLESREPIRRGGAVRQHCSDKKVQKRQKQAARPGGFPAFFRQPVVRSGGAVHRRAVALRRVPFRAAESLAAPASPSPMKDGFWIGDSNRNTNEGFAVASFHGTLTMT